MDVSVRTFDLKLGMVVARDLKDPHGRFLLSAGEKISNKHLKVFKVWGVPEVFIREPSISKRKKHPSEHLDPQIKKAIEEEVKIRFSRNKPNQPFIKELMKVCVQRKLKASRE